MLIRLSWLCIFCLCFFFGIVYWWFSLMYPWIHHLLLFTCLCSPCLGISSLTMWLDHHNRRRQVEYQHRHQFLFPFWTCIASWSRIPCMKCFEYSMSSTFLSKGSRPICMTFCWMGIGLRLGRLRGKVRRVLGRLLSFELSPSFASCLNSGPNKSFNRSKKHSKNPKRQGVKLQPLVRQCILFLEMGLILYLGLVLIMNRLTTKFWFYSEIMHRLHNLKTPYFNCDAHLSHSFKIFDC